MKTNLLLLATLMATGMQVGQAKEPNRSGGSMSVKGIQPFTCDPTGERCVIPVYARADPASDACGVRIDFSPIVVPKHATSGKKIRVVWQLFEAEIGDTNQYRFRSNGIEIKNVTPADFDQPGHENTGHEDALKRRYKWRSVNTNTGSTSGEYPFDYDINTEYRKSALFPWKKCDQTDPRIINK
jgi:hypothetical protein